jgi:hypothetical protein
MTNNTLPKIASINQAFNQTQVRHICSIIFAIDDNMSTISVDNSTDQPITSHYDLNPDPAL